MRDALATLCAGSVLAALFVGGCTTNDDVDNWHDAMNGAAVGADTVTPSNYGAGATPASPPPPFYTTASITCKPIVAGTNSVVVNGKTRKFEAVSKDGKTFTRAYVGGFASHADAVAFCSALKAAGKPCFVK